MFEVVLIYVSWLDLFDSDAGDTGWTSLIPDA